MLFGWAQDHKRAFDGEQGPNTGGMGTYSPAPVFTPELVEQARTRLVEPAFAGIAADGAPYRGVLFVGADGDRRTGPSWSSSTPASAIPNARC